MIYLALFWNFFQVGLLGFGGGYAALPLIQSRIVEGNGWLNLQEFADLIAISQMTPGPIALNAASFVGTRVAGIGGAVVATLGNVMPSAIIVSVLALLYNRYSDLTFVKGVLSGLRPVVVALISSAALSILLITIRSGGTLLTLTSAVLLAIVLLGVWLIRRFRINNLVVMLGMGVLGGALYLLGVRY